MSVALERVRCYLCGADSTADFVVAEDDLTGRPGRFPFVRCRECGLAYQNPRIPIEEIKAWYDDDYIAHRERRAWGLGAPLVARAMARLDRRKEAIVRRHVALGPLSEVLDAGCGAGTFLLRLRERYGSRVTGVDFKDFSGRPGFEAIEFHCGLLADQPLRDARFELVTMWHFLEHDYDPAGALETARRLLAPHGRLIVEVPRLDSVTWRLYRGRWPGLQAPQHTALYTKATLLALLARTRLEVVEYLPYGAFPAYFYLFAGAAFVARRGRGLDLERAVVPYFLGQVALAPLLAFERRLNLAMQTVVCRRRV